MDGRCAISRTGAAHLPFYMIYHMRAAGMPVCRHPGLTLCHDIRLADTQESGWEHSSDRYGIYRGEEGELGLTLYNNPDVPVDKCIFTATYTADASAEAPGTDDPADKPDGGSKNDGSAKTGDDMDIVLFAGILVLSLAGAVTAGVYGRRRNAGK